MTPLVASLPEEGAAVSCCGCSAPPPPRPVVRTEAELRELLSYEPPEQVVIDLLQEEAPLYDQLDSIAVSRIRGALLLALGPGRLSERALPYVLEELQSAHDPYLTAVCARVLRQAAPNPDFVGPLLDAILYIRHQDDSLRLSTYGGRGAEGPRTTAMAEVLGTLGALGGAARAALPRLRELVAETPGPVTEAAARAAIAAIEQAPVAYDSPGVEPGLVNLPVRRSAPLQGFEFEDQDGVRLVSEDFFVGRPTIVVFFYTRCDNPTKCALTITKLGRLQALLRDEGLNQAIQTAAITYDPAYDRPEQLAQYRDTWGADTGPRHRFLRTTGDMDALRAHFELGVNFVSSVVNRHRLEAYILDSQGRITDRITRMRWSERDLITRALNAG